MKKCSPWKNLNKALFNIPLETDLVVEDVVVLLDVVVELLVVDGVVDGVVVVLDEVVLEVVVEDFKLSSLLTTIVFDSSRSITEGCSIKRALF